MEREDNNCENLNDNNKKECMVSPHWVIRWADNSTLAQLEESETQSERIFIVNFRRSNCAGLLETLKLILHQRDES